MQFVELIAIERNVLEGVASETVDRREKSRKIDWETRVL